MTTFVQLHLLTAYAPANLNRDDLGRPKTAVMGNAQRLRVSSQSLKRAWRTSEVFADALNGHVGVRTKMAADPVYKALRDSGVADKKALDWARQVTEVFGKPKAEGIETEQLVHLTPEEQQRIDALAKTLASEQRAPTDDELALLSQDHTAADVALFGRMLAAKPQHSVEAAAQVAHAITVHKAVVEDDFFTAVDDRNPRDDVGSSHMGTTEFGAGLFYLYLNINRDLLIENLGGNRDLAGRALQALLQAAATVSPTGKQASFGSHAHAEYILTEVGTTQPRSLATAFYKPVSGTDVLPEAIRKLEDVRNRMNTAYDAPTAAVIMNAVAGTGTLADVLAHAVA